MRLLSNELYKNITTSKIEEYDGEHIKIDNYPDTRRSATAIKRQIIEMRSLLMEISRTIC
jgi:adenylate kinase family enzyme